MGLRVLCVIPVGPGHSVVAMDAVQSIMAAELPDNIAREVAVVDDSEGLTGRSAARNEGARSSDSDWLFFLDADDLAYPGCFQALAAELVAEPDLEALWGPIMVRRETIYFDGKRIKTDERQYHCKGPPISTWEELLAAGTGSLMVGMFVKRALFERIGGWCEAIDLSEDYDFCWAAAAHARAWRKGENPLVLIRRDNSSATGRRGVDPVAVREITELAALRHHAIANYWRARGQVPWTKKERTSRPAIYGDFGARWRAEPYGPTSA